MSEDEVLVYVRATATLLSLPLDEARAQAVAVHLGRTVAMAKLLENAPLAPEHEIAEVYRPAPFPPEDAA